METPTGMLYEQYGGFHKSTNQQYYNARKPVDETPLEYLYRLNVAAIRAKIKIREGPPNVRREHVDHFIGTLDARDPAKQLSFMRLMDTGDVEETLQSYERTANRVKKSPMEPNQFRPRAGKIADPAPSKTA